MVGRQFAARKVDALLHAVTVGDDGEVGREGVDGLDADAVQPDGFLEGLGAKLAAGVECGDGLGEVALRDTAAEVAHADGAVGDVDVDTVTGLHAELVDGVVDHFLEQDVDAVVTILASVRVADVHAGAFTDGLESFEGDNVAVVVCGDGGDVHN